VERESVLNKDSRGRNSYRRHFERKGALEKTNEKINEERMPRIPLKRISGREMLKVISELGIPKKRLEGGKPGRADGLSRCMNSP